jgi:orotidine-5'-phosphate decarboxylase
MSPLAPLAPRDRLIVALDLPTIRHAEALIETLGDTVTFYKIGYQLAFERGLPLAYALAAAGKRVFLDMKLHDIGNTVARGVENVARMGVTFLTVHAYPQTMRAAVAAKAGSNLRLLGVTVLTSYDDADLAEAGYGIGVEQLVAGRARLARDVGVDGLVCSAAEAAPLRLIVGPDMTLVTPGIRPAGAERGDQKRVATPASAIAAGADYLVVGRPILAAEAPREAAQAIIDEIAEAAGGSAAGR